jgi:hypothetical protein
MLNRVAERIVRRGIARRIPLRDLRLERLPYSPLTSFAVLD